MAILNIREYVLHARNAKICSRKNLLGYSKKKRQSPCKKISPALHIYKQYPISVRRIGGLVAVCSEIFQSSTNIF